MAVGQPIRDKLPESNSAARSFCSPGTKLILFLGFSHINQGSHDTSRHALDSHDASEGIGLSERAET